MKTFMTSLILTNAVAVVAAVTLGGIFWVAIPAAAAVTVGLMALNRDEIEAE